MTSPAFPVNVDSLPPKEIVAALDQYVVGQREAKQAVAIAIRNRWRRKQLPVEIAEEVMPKNIIMIGPTGVGKTEIARRLATMIDAPFIKVEASKYTEVGYQGRDVESMVRDLVKLSISQVKTQAMAAVTKDTEHHTEERLLDLLLPAAGNDFLPDSDSQEYNDSSPNQRTREKLRSKLREGKLDLREVEFSTRISTPIAGVFGMAGGEEMGLDMQDMLNKMLPSKKKDRRVTIAEARRLIMQEESEKLIDEDEINRIAINRAEQSGIIFIDELDKLIAAENSRGPDVSREGVQRDLLPIVEGSNVNTRYGMVRTEHILFIAAGAFHGKKPSDLIPELQGRFPIRVNLEPLTKADFIRILVHPRNALTRQVALLLATEGVEVRFEEDSLTAIAELAEKVNGNMQNIGARRLHTIMEKLMQEISFNAPDMTGQRVSVTSRMVHDQLKNLIEDEDLTKYIL